MESLVLGTPLTYSSTVTLTLERITIDLVAQSVIVQWKDQAGRGFTALYSTPPPPGATQLTGAALIHTLNTAVPTPTLSFIKAIFQQLQTDGYIGAGTISGVPQ